MSRFRFYSDDDDEDDGRDLEGRTPSAAKAKTLSTILEKKRNSLLGDLMEDKYELCILFGFLILVQFKLFLNKPRDLFDSIEFYNELVQIRWVSFPPINVVGTSRNARKKPLM